MKAFVPIIAKAIRDAGDTIVLRMVYEGEDGVKKRRYISPYRFIDDENSAFLAMCLTTGEVRRFIVDRCSEVREFESHEVEMPMPLEPFEAEQCTQ